MRKIAVLLPLTALKTIEVPETSVWASCQKIVDGSIEPVYFTNPEPTPENDGRPFSVGWHLAAYVNEEGICRGYPPCWELQRELGDVVTLFGPIVIVRERIDGHGDTFYADLTDADLENVRARTSMLVPLRRAAPGQPS